MPIRSGDKLRFAAVVVAIFALLLGAKLALSLGAEKPCEGSMWGCRFGLKCERGPGGHLCRHKCDADQDCPPGQGCALILSAVGDTDRVTQICYPYER